jgi:DNA polymerase V
MKFRKGTRAINMSEIKVRFGYEAPVFFVNKGNNRIIDAMDEVNMLDLNEYLAPNPMETFLVEVSGESMKDANIQEGDILVVDTHEEPKDGKIIVASLNSELVVKKLRIIDEKVYLYSANEKFTPLEILPLLDFRIQGVVKHVIRNV